MSEVRKDELLAEQIKQAYGAWREDIFRQYPGTMELSAGLAFAAGFKACQDAGLQFDPELTHMFPEARASPPSTPPLRRNLTDLQPMPTPGQQDVTETLIDWLRERQAKGIATYGRSLETFNGRSAPRDLREELLDALQYTHQWELEQAAMVREVEQLRAEVAAIRAREVEREQAMREGLAAIGTVAQTGDPD
ncbi:MAG: hypothetical protein KGL39_36825 [Patescibacteria group bacterium]|nr:hypothetical protein [Patescibacteria group bacterium]